MVERGDELVGLAAREHPAAVAWARVRSGGTAPAGVTLLKQKEKTAVYRLAGVGPGGCAVVAKRCRPESARVERTVYERVLARLPVHGLRYYGCVEEPAGRCCWLFLGELVADKYSAALEEHRRLAGRWLGLLHTSVAPHAGTVPLPDRGSGHHRECLDRVRATVLRNMTNPALSPDGAAVLESMVARCDALAAWWGRVEKLCSGMPQTLVHGDFVKRNLRVRNGPDGPDLLVFDWENAGWGVPAVDLTGATFSGDPDLAAYWSVVSEVWPGIDVSAVERWAALGTVFRFLVGADWDVPALATPWIEKAVSRLSAYQRALAGAVRTLGWEE